MILILCLFVLSSGWFTGSVIYHTAKSNEPTDKRLAIAVGPLAMMVLIILVLLFL